MKISKEARRAARKLFRACFAQGHLDESRVRTLVASVSQKKPRHYLGILSEIQRMAVHEVEKSTAHVESAAPLKPAAFDDIQTQLQKKFPQKLHFTHAHNPALIAGLRVQVGSHVWDGSVRARLEQLKIQN